MFKFAGGMLAALFLPMFAAGQDRPIVLKAATAGREGQDPPEHSHCD